MSKARENSLWKWLKQAKLQIGQELDMHRVENSVSQGMPDVEGFLGGAGQFWAELKAAERPKKPDTPVRFDVREAQVEWLRRRWSLGGAAWLLVQVGSGRTRDIYLIDGSQARDVQRGMTEKALREIAAFGTHSEPRATYAEDFVRAMALGHGYFVTEL